MKEIPYSWRIRSRGAEHTLSLSYDNLAPEYTLISRTVDPEDGIRPRFIPRTIMSRDPDRIKTELDRADVPSRGRPPYRAAYRKMQESRT